MNIDEQRKAFEKWISEKYSGFNAFDIRFNNETNDYDHMPTQARWEAWLASANREGYKLAPVKATDSQWAAGIDAYTQAMDGQNILSASAFFDIYEAMMGAIE